METFHLKRNAQKRKNITHAHKHASITGQHSTQHNIETREMRET